MGHLQKPLWTRRIEIVKKRTVMQNRNLCPSLCVPGDLSVMQREVAVAFRLQVDNSERSPHPSQIHRKLYRTSRHLAFNSSGSTRE